MKKQKTLLSKKQTNFAYGMGAAVVIVGALFKITHIELGPLTGNLMLTVGLLVEAGIFALSAFEPVEDDVQHSSTSASNFNFVDFSGSEEYNKQLEHATRQLESINNLYQTQLETANDFNQLRHNTKELAENLSLLNKKLGNVLGAFYIN